MLAAHRHTEGTCLLNLAHHQALLGSLVPAQSFVDPADVVRKLERASSLSWLVLVQTEEQLKKRVGAKLEVAKFLQDTVSEMAKDMRTSGRTGAAQASAADLYQFMKRVRALNHTHRHTASRVQTLDGEAMLTCAGL